MKKLLFVWIFLLSCFNHNTATASSWIKTSGNKLITDSNQPFVVRSVQYVKVVKDVPGTNGFPLLSMFTPHNYDAAKVETDLTNISSLGYNTIRVVYHNGLDNYDYRLANRTEGMMKCVQGTNYQLQQCIKIQSVDNLIHLLSTAEKNNLKVILSFVGNDPPSYQTGTSETNKAFLTYVSNDLDRYYRSFFSYLKTKIDLSVILAVQPEAEPALITSPESFSYSVGDNLGEKGFNTSQTQIVTSNFLSTNRKINGQSHPDIKHFLNDISVSSFNKIFESVRSVEPRLLMFYDQFAAIGVRDDINRHVDDLVIFNPLLNADIVGLQLYPEYLKNGESLDDVFNFTPGFKELTSTKPFMMIEFGLNKLSEPNITTIRDRIPYLLDWVKKSCTYSMEGWSYFNWSADNFDYVTASQDNFTVGKVLSPKYLPNPCNGQLNGLAIQGNTPTVYLIQDNKKYAFTSVQSLTDYGLSLVDVIQVSDNFISQIEDGGTTDNLQIPKGDINHDKIVDFLDFGIWKNEYLNKLVIRADLNSDHKVDFLDFGIWKTAYLQNSSRH